MISDSGEEILVEVTARRPSKQLEAIELPTSLDKFLEKVMGMDFERAINKVKEQENK